MTIFCKKLKLDTCAKILDFYFLEGETFFHKAAVALGIVVLFVVVVLSISLSLLLVAYYSEEIFNMSFEDVNKVICASVVVVVVVVLLLFFFPVVAERI